MNGITRAYRFLTELPDTFEGFLWLAIVMLVTVIVVAGLTTALVVYVEGL